MKTKLFLTLTACLLLVAPLARAQVVSNTNSTGAGSLRAVVAAAANNATITFAAGLSGQTISLGSSQIVLNTNVTIDASALPLGIQITQPPNPSSRIFQVASNTTVVLKALTLHGGDPGYALGGAILNQGNLTLTSCTLYGNNSSFGGGAIANDGGTLTINQCTLTGNVTWHGIGGAIISDGGSITINQSTITQNPSDDAVYLGSTSFSLFNSIIAGNPGSDLSLYNVNPNYAKGTNLIGGDPLLLPLGHYGGPTQTMPPRTNSPALNAGSDFTLIAPFPAPIGTGVLFPNDQRGLPRIFGAHVDIGAAELQSPMVVTNLADAGPGSLRQAVSDGDEPAGAIITFAAGLSGQTIGLTSGELLLNKNLTIDASALTNGITLSGNYASRIFNLGASGNVTLAGLTLTGGNASPGGAIYSAGGSSLLVSRCTFLSNNALEGGAILNDGTLLMENSTFSSNTSGYGGALQCRNLATLKHCTLSGNSAGYGGGIYNKFTTLTLNNSIVAGNTAGGGGGDILDQQAALVFTGANLIQNIVEEAPSSRSGPDPLTNAPLLSVLGNYGGPTRTMPPQAGSPAIDGCTSGTSFATDQRGLPRISGLFADIGAVELQIIIATNPPVQTGLTRLGNGNFQFSFTNQTGASFTVFASTNVALPFNGWSNLGPAVETPASSGQYQFTDPAATNNPQRFYRVRSP